jgi:hypothetical protein
MSRHPNRKPPGMESKKQQPLIVEKLMELNDSLRRDFCKDSRRSFCTILCPKRDTFISNLRAVFFRGSGLLGGVEVDLDIEKSKVNVTFIKIEATEAERIACKDL